MNQLYHMDALAITVSVMALFVVMYLVWDWYLNIRPWVKASIPNRT
jgi:hypothetical protein